MKWFYIFLLAILMTGCSAESSKEKEEAKQPDAPAVEESKEKTIERTNEQLEDLLQEVDMSAKMAEACPRLSVEMTTAYLEPDQKRPSIISFCHHNGDVSLEGETAWFGLATFDESADEWKTELAKNEFLSHPANFVGSLKLDGGSERVAIEIYEHAAEGGRTGILVLSVQDQQLKIERVDSTATQYGKVRVEKNQLIIEDAHTVETYTYELDDVTHTTELKQSSAKSDLVITYNKENDAAPLTASIPNGEILDVQPGDVIKFTPEKPLSLYGFQIRTSMQQQADEPDTFIVSESDLGETIEFGENPFDQMITYTIGDSKWFASREYLDELKKGRMPGSKVQLSDSNKEIANLLKGEYQISEFGYMGAKHLEYEKFIYAIPYLKEEGDKIYTVIRKLPVERILTGDDFIRSWGEPDSQQEDIEFDPPVLNLFYELNKDYRVQISLQENRTDSSAAAISLYKKY
ncbi:hypothetical protein [Cytobacillus massiliigabonensis]|uniref:hypothetical protein n=1 Tax=Cytobacillus massiliigabonensis TaxID=1871011 RepID=UPI000C81D547|nr:hypothetical protein [Cytobacillus massiliigabonensis]